MWKKVLTWIILAVLIAYVVAISVWAHAEARKNSCKGITIEIVKTEKADSISTKGVLSEINSYPGKILGQQIPAINTREIEKHLKKMPQFEDVVCNFTTDGRLHVKVTPMVPELRVFEDSISYYINKEGKKMQSKASFFVDVPVVSGHFKGSFQAKDLLPVTRFIARDEALNSLVGMVYADSPDNIILIPRIHGHVINFGDTTRLKEKRDALIAIYRKVIPYKGWEEYDTISVKYRGQVVASRRNKFVQKPQNGEFDEPDMEESTLPEIETTETQNP